MEYRCTGNGRVSEVYFNQPQPTQPTTQNPALRQVDEWLQTIRNQPQSQELQQQTVNKNQKLNLLESAYEVLIQEILSCGTPQKLPKEIALRLANVMCLYGQMCYANPEHHNSFEFTKQMLLPALNLYLYATDTTELLVDFRDPNMESFPTLLNYVKLNVASIERELNPSLTTEDEPEKREFFSSFTYIGDLFAGIDLEVLIEKVANSKMSPEDHFSYAYALRYLNGAYRESHNRGQCVPEEETIRQYRHEQLVNLAGLILKLEPLTEQKTREYFELAYNDLTGYYRLKKDTNAYEATYDWLLAHAENDEQFRRIYNKRAFGEPEGSPKRMEYAAKAREYEEKIKVKDIENQSLRALFLSNETYHLLQKPEWTLEEAQLAKANIEKAKQLADELKKYGLASTEHDNVYKNYEAVQKRLNQAVSLAPQADPLLFNQLFQQALGEMGATAPAMENRNWVKAGEHISSAIKILTEMKSQLKSPMLEMVNKLLGQATVIQDNIQNNLEEEELALAIQMSQLMVENNEKEEGLKRN